MEEMPEHHPVMSYHSARLGKRVFRCSCGDEFGVIPEYGQHLDEVDPPKGS